PSSRGWGQVVPADGRGEPWGFSAGVDEVLVLPQPSPGFGTRFDERNAGLDLGQLPALELAADLLDLLVGGPELVLVLAEEPIARAPVPVGDARVAVRPGVRQVLVHDAPSAAALLRASARESIARLLVKLSGSVRSTTARLSHGECETDNR